jgi:hypothetical protein
VVRKDGYLSAASRRLIEVLKAEWNAGAINQRQPLKY